MRNIRCMLLCCLFSGFFLQAVYAHREAAPVRQFSGKGEISGRVGSTTFWDFDSNGNLYVSDTENLRVQKFTREGQWLLSIDGSEEEAEYTFRNPSDIAVSRGGEIYVADWALLPIEGYSDPPLYTYAPVVHHFAVDGTWKGTFPLDPPETTVRALDRAAPGMDAEGRPILILPQGDTERGFRLTVTRDGTLLALDEGKLYLFDALGSSLDVLLLRRKYPGWIDGVTDLAAVDMAHIYLLDTPRHRIVRIDRQGDVLSVIGRYGDQDGQLKEPEHFTVLENGDLLVADAARYERFIDSLLPRRNDDPSQKSLYELPGRRRLRTRLLRVQRFSPDGDFHGKILLRLDRENAYERDLRWLTLSPEGQLYLQHPDTLTIEQYAPVGGFRLDALRTEVSLHYEQDELRVEIDNPEDLDLRRDYDETWRLQLVAADLRFRYDYNERMRVSWEHNGLYFYSKQEDFYSQEFEDIARGAFNQSDKTLEDYLAGLTTLSFDWVLSDEPYDYRTAGLSLYLGGGRYGVINDAIDLANQRYLDWKLWFSEWGGRFHYDFARRWQMRWDISHGPAYGYFNYEFDYIDEIGMLFATGFREGNQTQILFSIDGVF